MSMVVEVRASAQVPVRRASCVARSWWRRNASTACAVINTRLTPPVFVVLTKNSVTRGGDGPFDPDTPLVEVDVSPTQAADLAATGAGGGRHVDPARHAWVVGGGVGDERPHVRRRRRADGRPRHRRARRVGRQVARQQAPADGVRHRPVQHDVGTPHPGGTEAVVLQRGVQLIANRVRSTSTTGCDPAPARAGCTRF